MLRLAHNTARYTLLLCTVLAAGALAEASAPKAVITGPTNASPGDLVILKSSASENAVGFAWALIDSDKTFYEPPGSGDAIFACGTPGRYTFALVAANVVDGKPLVSIAKHTVTLGQPGPGPNPPGPNPGPNPNPLPPGKYGLAQFARDSAAGVALDANAKRSSAAALANSFDSIAATVAAGAITKPEEIIAATKSSNINALGQNRLPWTAWGGALQAKLNQLSESRQMVTPDDHITAWREIAAGLRAVQ